MSPASRRRIVAIARRDARAQMRNPGHWFLLLVLPLVDGLLFGSIGVAFGEGQGPVELLVTGVLLFHLIWQLTLAGSLGLLEEVWSRNLMNLIATPLTEREFLASLGLVGIDAVQKNDLRDRRPPHAGRRDKVDALQRFERLLNLAGDVVFRFARLGVGVGDRDQDDSLCHLARTVP